MCVCVCLFYLFLIPFDQHKMSVKRSGSRIPSAASHRNDNASTFSTNESTTGSRQRQSKRDEVVLRRERGNACLIHK